MTFSLESQRVGSMLEYNYAHSEQLRMAGFCVDWHPETRHRALSFIAGHISPYDEASNLLILHYHMHGRTPIELGGAWKLKLETMDVLRQILRYIV